MKLKIYLIVIIIFISFININSLNIKSTRANEITADEIWDSDKIILESLIINAVITIEPGITVYLNKDVNLNVKDGAIKAVGTEDNRITFKKYTEDSWGKITFWWAGIFKYCDIIGGQGIYDYTTTWTICQAKNTSLDNLSNRIGR